MCHMHTHTHVCIRQKLLGCWKTRKMSGFLHFFECARREIKSIFLKAQSRLRISMCPTRGLPSLLLLRYRETSRSIQPARAQVWILPGFRIVSFVQSYYLKLRTCKRRVGIGGPGTNAGPHLLSVLRGIGDSFCIPLCINFVGEDK